MLRANVNVRPVDAALEVRPEAFNGVHASTARVGIMPHAVVQFDGVAAKLVNALEPAKFIGVPRRAGQQVRLDKVAHRFFGAPTGNAGDKLPVALQHADNARLIAFVAAAHAADRTTNQRLINLDRRADAAKRVVAVERSHVGADLVTHAPSGFVGDAQLALDLFRGHAVPARREHEHHKEPIAQRRPRAVKRRPSGREHLIAAPLASVGTADLDAGELWLSTARSPLALDSQTLGPKYKWKKA